MTGGGWDGSLEKTSLPSIETQTPVVELCSLCTHDLRGSKGDWEVG
jgi:hypothetical protein